MLVPVSNPADWNLLTLPTIILTHFLLAVGNPELWKRRNDQLSMINMRI